MKRHTLVYLVSVFCALFCAHAARAVTTVFFNPAQTATVVTTNMASATISSSGYLITYSLDNWWYPTISIGPGTPTGRFSSVNWPNGVQAQTITAGPTGSLTSQISASITIRRVDGMPFDLGNFTGQILGNTAGAGAAFEIMPQLNGQDGFPNPLTFDATGYAGNSFTYSPALTGYDAYIMSLWMDFALTHLLLIDASANVQPTLQISTTSSNYVRLNWPTNSTGFALQQKSEMATANWLSMTDAVAIVGTNFEAKTSATNGPRFFRLMHP